MPPEPSDEEDYNLEIQLGLLGDDNERRSTIARLYEKYRDRLMCFLEIKLPFIPADEAASAVNDAFGALYKKACEGTLDTNKSVRSLLFTIAHRKAIDEIRKRSSRETNNEEFAAEIAQVLYGTDVGSAWKIFSGTDNLADKVSSEFRNFVLSLPPKQKVVAEAMADGVALSDPEIVKEIYRRRRTVVSTVEVKGAKQALMQKFREILKRKGIR